MPTNITTPKPKAVHISITLFTIALASGLINSIIKEVTLGKKPLLIAILVCIFLIIGVFIYQISRGKKWARITFLILFIVGMYKYPSTIMALFKSNPIQATVSVIGILLQLVAFYFIFTKESNEWFNSYDVSLDVNG